MLRITQKAADEQTAFIMVEGRIMGRAGLDLFEFCEKKQKEGIFLTLDLTRVSFVDLDGIRGLTDLRRNGAHVIGCSVLVRQLLDWVSPVEEATVPDDSIAFGLTVSDDCPD